LGVQDVDTRSVVSPVVKEFRYVNSSEKLIGELERALEVSMDKRPGPVWLEIPVDVQNDRRVLYHAPLPAIALRANRDTPDLNTAISADLDGLLNRISDSERPLMVLGGGFSSCLENLEARDFVAELGIPFVATWAAMDTFDWDNPLYLGNFGILGERAPNLAIGEADLVLVLGSRLSIPNIGYDSEKFAPNAFVIAVDIDPVELDKNSASIDLAIEMDLGQFSASLRERFSPGPLPKSSLWRARCLGTKNSLRLEREEEIVAPGKLDVYAFSRLLSEYFAGDEYLVTVDMGTACTAFVQSFRHNGRGRFIRAHGLSAMGYSLPAAIGVAKGHPGSRVCCVAGDGAFQLNIQELQAISYGSLPIKIFCLNSRGYRAIEIMQENLFEERYFGSREEGGFSNPDFVKVGRAFGIRSISVTSPSGLKEALESDQFRDSLPLLIEISIPEDQRHRPRVVNKRSKDGVMYSPSLGEMWPELPPEVL